MRPIVFLLLAACGTAPDDSVPGDTDATDPTVDPTDPPTGSDPLECGEFIELEPGIGFSSLTPIVDGDPVYIVTGDQGLWHVDIAGDVYGSSSQAISLAPSLYFPEGDYVLTPDDTPLSIGLIAYDAEACTGYFYGVQALINPPSPEVSGMPLQQYICSMMGKELELTMVVGDLVTGVTTEVVTTVVARPDETTNCGS